MITVSHASVTLAWAVAAGLLGCSASHRSPSDERTGLAEGTDLTTPGLRNGHAMVYDVRRDRVVLFGGADDRRVLADTWEL
jgi:hypothetical protein